MAVACGNSGVLAGVVGDAQAVVRIVKRLIDKNALVKSDRFMFVPFIHLSDDKLSPSILFTGCAL